MRELTEEERAEYDVMISGAKQLTIFGGEEEFDDEVSFFLGEKTYLQN